MERNKQQVVLNSNTRYKGENQMRDEKEKSLYTRDSLQKMSDRDLGSAENALVRRITILRREKQKTFDCEIELCYLQDEIFRRSSVVKQFRRRS